MLTEEMNSSRHPRNVLIVEDEPSICNLVCVMLEGLGCEGNIAPNGRQALAMIKKESFDAILLDLHCSEMPAEEMVSAISKLRPNLVGQVLVITDEVSDPETTEIIKRNCMHHISSQRIMHDLWDKLSAVLDSHPAESAA
jgi:CheY-like chemotaxis protein